MAIQYGSYDDRARFGIDVSMSPAAVTAATASVTLTWRVYLQSSFTNTPGFAGTYTLERSGSAPSGSGAVSVYTQGTTPQLLGTWTQTVSTSYSGSVSRTMGVEFSAALFNGARPEHARTFVVPERPPQVPNTPGAASGSLGSPTGTSASVSWSRGSGWSADATKVASYQVRRDDSSGSWTTVASGVAASATSWTNTGLGKGRRYRWGVRAVNATGPSGWGTSSVWLHTQPNVPLSPLVERDDDDILVTVRPHATTAPGTTFDIWDDATSSVVASGVSAGVWRHSAPNPAVVHRYRVLAKVSGSAANSAYSGWSPTVELQAPPAAPTNLAPDGVTVADDAEIVLTYAHVPVDSSPQRKRQIRRWLPGDGDWTVGSEETTTSQSLALDPGLPVGVHEWQVRTWGSHEDPSDWSASAFFPVAERPTITIVEPSGSIPGPSVTVAWTYYQAASVPQGARQVQVVVDSAVVADSGILTGTATSWTSPLVLEDASEPTIRVRVRSASGLWSDWDEITESVAYLPPAVPLLTAEWADLAVAVQLTMSAVDEVGSEDTITLRLEKSVRGGAWTLVEEMPAAEDIGFADFEVPLSGSIDYRLVAVSALPSVAVSEVVTITPPHDLGDHSRCGIWLSAGPGFAASLLLRWNPAMTFTSGRLREQRRYSGRPHPIQRDSIHLARTASVSASLMPKDHAGGSEWVHPDEIHAFFCLAGPYMCRTPDGQVIYVTPGLPDYEPGGVGRLGSISVSLTETERGTDAQRAAFEALNGSVMVELMAGEYVLFGPTSLYEPRPGEFEVGP